MLFLWSGLLLAGTISALINSAYLDLWAFPQLRFCPPELNDTFPVSNSGAAPFAASEEWGDAYYWNTTVYDTFTASNVRLPTACIYPCFTSTWPLRDPTEINVVSNSFGHQNDNDTGWRLFFTVYFIVSSSCLSSLTILAVDISRQPPRSMVEFIRRFREWTSRTIAPVRMLCSQKISKRFRLIWRAFLPSSTSTQYTRYHHVLFPSIRTKLESWGKIRSRVMHFYLKAITLYARCISPCALVFFVGWSEWYMYVNDPGGESFKHVGQWGALVAAVIVGVAAGVGQLMSKTSGPKPPVLPTTV